MRPYGPEEYFKGTLWALLLAPLFLIMVIVGIGTIAAWGYILWRLGAMVF